MICTIAREIVIEAGEYADWKALAGFHYRAGRVAGVVRIFRARHRGRLAGVLVETLPLLASGARDAATGERFVIPDRLLAAALLNDEVRCISRVIVHPVFRSLGLAVRLVGHALEQADTTYVEAFAAMGRVHPFFEKAGMRAYERPADEPGERMTAALAHAGLEPMDLCAPGKWQAAWSGADEGCRAFLGEELRRYCGYGRRAVSTEEQIIQARRKLLSEPVYYLWKRP
jgi:GNAT superfamily N-acetyltransferase